MCDGTPPWPFIQQPAQKHLWVSLWNVSFLITVVGPQQVFLHYARVQVRVQQTFLWLDIVQICMYVYTYIYNYISLMCPSVRP